MRDDAVADLVWAADCCLRVGFGDERDPRTRARVRAAAAALHARTVDALVDVTPAYATVLLTFEPIRLDAARAEQQVRAALAAATPAELPAPRVVEIPTCYERACALDLDAVAQSVGLRRDEVVARHSGARYTVAFLGFAPGFPYLDGLPERLAVPRLREPRVRVPWGSVAIAGRQAGIYPHATAGGWRLVGRTPLLLFAAGREPPALLRLGDEVRFVPIDHGEHVARAATAP